MFSENVLAANNQSLPLSRLRLEHGTQAWETNVLTITLWQYWLDIS